MRRKIDICNYHSRPVVSLVLLYLHCSTCIVIGVSWRSVFLFIFWKAKTLEPNSLNNSDDICIWKRWMNQTFWTRYTYSSTTFSRFTKTWSLLVTLLWTKSIWSSMSSTRPKGVVGDSSTFWYQFNTHIDLVPFISTSTSSGTNHLCNHHSYKVCFILVILSRSPW